MPLLINGKNFSKKTVKDILAAIMQLPAPLETNANAENYSETKAIIFGQKEAAYLNYADDSQKNFLVTFRVSFCIWLRIYNDNESCAVHLDDVTKLNWKDILSHFKNKKLKAEIFGGWTNQELTRHPVSEKIVNSIIDSLKAVRKDVEIDVVRSFLFEKNRFTLERKKSFVLSILESAYYDTLEGCYVYRMLEQPKHFRVPDGHGGYSKNKNQLVSEEVVNAVISFFDNIKQFDQYYLNAFAININNGNLFLLNFPEDPRTQERINRQRSHEIYPLIITKTNASENKAIKNKVNSSADHHSSPISQPKTQKREWAPQALREKFYPLFDKIAFSLIEHKIEMVKPPKDLEKKVSTYGCQLFMLDNDENNLLAVFNFSIKNDADKIVELFKINFSESLPKNMKSGNNFCLAFNLNPRLSDLEEKLASVLIKIPEAFKQPTSKILTMN